MYAIDFEYDGHFLSDRGFMICNFDYNDGISELESGSQITLNKVPHFGGKKYSISSTQYDDCIETTFDICRIPEDYEYSNREISMNDFRDIVRWLNRSEFLLFRFIENDEDTFFEKPYCYFYATFNVTKLMLNDRLYGIRLKMLTNSPFGFAEEETYTVDFATNNSVTIIDKSDEIGYISPDVTITCNAAGKVYFENSSAGIKTEIKNCTQGEVITIKGEQQIITTDSTAHKIYNDFNFVFPKIKNTYSSRANVFTKLSDCISCTIVIKYRPIIKEVF